MKKSLSALLAALFLCVSSVFANPKDMIEFKNLPKNQELQNEIKEFFEHSYENLYSLDLEQRDNAHIDQTKKLLSLLDEVKNPNYDTQVLKLLVKHWLFIVGEVSLDEVIALSKELDEKYKKNAAHHWVMMYFYTSLVCTGKAWNEAQIYTKLQKKTLSLDFIYDYASACFICGKRLQSISILMNEIPDFESSDLFHIISDLVQSPKIADYKAEQVWFRNPTPSEDGYMFIDSTMLGISVKVRPEWNVETSAFDEENPASLVIDAVVNDENGKSARITISAEPVEKQSKIFVKNYESFMNDEVSPSEKTFRKGQGDKEHKWLLKSYESDYGERTVTLYARTNPSNEDITSLDCEHVIDFEQFRFSRDESRKWEDYISEGKSFTRFEGAVEILVEINTLGLSGKEADKFLSDFMNSLAVFQ